MHAATLDKLDDDEIKALEKKGRANIFHDEVDSDGQLLWKGSNPVVE